MPLEFCAVLNITGAVTVLIHFSSCSRIYSYLACPPLTDIFFVEVSLVKQPPKERTHRSISGRVRSAKPLLKPEKTIEFERKRESTAFCALGPDVFLHSYYGYTHERTLAFFHLVVAKSAPTTSALRFMQV